MKFGGPMSYSLEEIFIKLDTLLSENPNARLVEFSQSLNIKQHTVQKAVREATGVSFREYQKQRILMEAVRLLAEKGELSEGDIALRVGYKSADSLFNFVKLETGTNPNDFRWLGVRTERGLTRAEDSAPRPDFSSPAGAQSRSFLESPGFKKPGF
jgi:methylphosphotriester-DNA--protein-cysteine methyltransferase